MKHSFVVISIKKVVIVLCGMSLLGSGGVWDVTPGQKGCVGCHSWAAVVCGMSLLGRRGVWDVTPGQRWCVGCHSWAAVVCGMSRLGRRGGVMIKQFTVM
jgi:nitrate/TMAO reductase-like tetraheme cytochrome c subunit